MVNSIEEKQAINPSALRLSVTMVILFSGIA